MMRVFNIASFIRNFIIEGNFDHGIYKLSYQHQVHINVSQESK